MRVILLGPPGSGKGTQGDLVEKKYGFPRISTGDLLRQSVRNKTPLGLKVEARMMKGDLVSDDTVVEIVKEKILSLKGQKGYVLDGFPRNLAQARKLDEIDGSRAEVVLDVLIQEKLLVGRLSARRICPKCETVYNIYSFKPRNDGMCDKCGEGLIQRKDDRPDVIRERLRVYHEETEPLLDYYKKKGVYHPVHGEGKVTQVFDEIESILDCEIAKSKEFRTTL